MPARVTVVGSLNIDLVIKAPRLPQTGETVTGGEFATFAGGKGANQAVAAARLGAAVTMVGAVGSDAFGRQLRDGLLRDGIDVTHVSVLDGAASGVALITVDPRGQNTIVVAPGANGKLTPAQVEAARQAIASSQVLLLQLEVPLDCVVRAAELARGTGCRVVLDPAPAPTEPLPERLLRLVDVINPNEVEARALTGIAIGDEQGARLAAERLTALGCRHAVLKLGGRGAFVAAGGWRGLLPAVPVEAVDTTAAGDAFAGALAVALAEGADVAAAARLANLAGAISVTRMGAQPSMPTRADVEAFARARGLAL
ncbi:MAG: ribokinase [Armatimonadota bacterium]|nr:ribokinase [Armatimonadota bacterium]MDR7467734.1 ribokinase [Armatimonadota bacterium]MDR7494934.1 ribokinase [Armatimonadota bacterium]MDR7499801.1 ribokinase [Armatimonadota bacterium]MDR7505253.1 ribokinase [Armatimonadota bacterium]